MNTPNKFDLTPEAQQLLNVERRPMEPPAGAQARVRARVAMTVGALAAGATAAGTAKAAGAGGAAAGAGAGAGAAAGAGTAGGAALGGGLLLKVLAPVGLGAVLIGTVAAPAIQERLNGGAARATITQPEQRTPAATTPAVVDAQPEATQPPPAPAVTEPVRNVRRTPGSSSPTLQAERVGLDEARAALADGRAAAALKLLADHAREHPKGQLAEERDALTVMALAKDGKAAAARKAAALFHTRHPRSVLSGAVDAAVSSDK